MKTLLRTQTSGPPCLNMDLQQKIVGDIIFHIILLDGIMSSNCLSTNTKCEG